MGMIVNDPEIVLELARKLVRRNLIEYIEMGGTSFAKFMKENDHIINNPGIHPAGRGELSGLARNSLVVIADAKRVAARTAAAEARKEVLESLRRSYIVPYCGKIILCKYPN